MEGSKLYGKSKDNKRFDENPSDKLQARVKENYWNFMANVILSFEPKEKKRVKSSQAIYERGLKCII